MICFSFLFLPGAREARLKEADVPNEFSNDVSLINYPLYSTSRDRGRHGGAARVNGRAGICGGWRDPGLKGDATEFRYRKHESFAFAILFFPKILFLFQHRNEKLSFKVPF